MIGNVGIGDVFVPVLEASAVGSLRPIRATDNQGNSYVLKKLTTSKSPLCCILMELTEQLGRTRPEFGSAMGLPVRQCGG